MTRPLRVHFSCGAASAVSLLLARKRGCPVDAVYADPGGEHPDNMRFLRDIESLTGIKIQIVRSAKYSSPMDVWTAKRFIKGPNGAPCTSELQRRPLLPYCDFDHDHIFGFDANEGQRLANIQKNEAPYVIRSLLIEKQMTKEDCFQILHSYGIELPAMYRLGFRNANCIGCPKGGRGYWNRIRQVFPEVFDQMAALQRELGPGSAFWPPVDGERVMLDDLPLDAGNHIEPDIACDLFCSDVATRAGLTFQGDPQ
jgi:3'-phosphoadenosine 5'-phosphosulfate sulfotransferase (PAPS reductase)/FAD synthetase